MQVTMILEFPASYCHLARRIMQVYLLYFFVLFCFVCLFDFLFKGRVIGPLLVPVSPFL